MGSAHYLSATQRLLGAFLVFLSMSFALCAAIAPVIAPVVEAAPPQQQTCEGSGGIWKDGKCGDNITNGPTLPATVTGVVNILLFIIGATAVIVIVIQGFRFVNSNGDTQAVSKAKNGIIFALIGLVVAVMAYAIINFILDQL